MRHSLRRNDVKEALAQGRTYCGEDTAMGVERLLWRCPSCGNADRLDARGDELHCLACGATWTLDSRAVLDEALSAGRGVLGVTAHWGAIELIPATLASLGYPVSVVLEVRTGWLRAALEKATRNSDVELIIASRGDRVLEKILAALARGRILMTQVDEVDSWRRRNSRTIELFGKRLFFDHSLDFIAKKAVCPAVGLFCGREGRLRYRLRCEGLASDPHAIDVSRAALALWERYTLQSPEQWYQWPKWKEMKADA